MKLKNKLSQLNKNELIFLSSKSAYFFIGTVEEFYNNHDKLCDSWLKKHKDALQVQQNRLKFAIEQEPKECEAFIEKKYDMVQRKTVQEVIPYEKAYEDWNKKVELQRLAVDESTKKVENFTPFLERDIKKVYKNMNGELVIHIVGKECGPYWFKEEAFREKE